jgi:putative Mn2+ efflux pump MntP
MGHLTILAIAVGLAMDAFSVAVATSVVLPRLTGGHVFRFAFHFGLFQAGMPLLGWLAGRSVVQWVAVWDHWLAFGLLGFVGGKAIYDGLRGETPEGARPADPTRGWSLVVLSVATSIDAFAVGLSLAWLGERIWSTVLVIGVVTAALTTAGMFMGRVLGARFGRRMSIVGGLVLVGIGVKILVEHLG